MDRKDEVWMQPRLSKASVSWCYQESLTGWQGELCVASWETDFLKEIGTKYKIL